MDDYFLKHLRASRSSHSYVLVKIGALKNFAIPTRDTCVGVFLLTYYSNTGIFQWMTASELLINHTDVVI